jgi:hypothetical protein
MNGGLLMAIRNYRQAKRAREETRKKKQQEKLQKKLTRVTAPDGTVVETPASDDTVSDPKTSP